MCEKGSLLSELFSFADIDARDVQSLFSATAATDNGAKVSRHGAGRSGSERGSVGTSRDGGSRELRDDRYRCLNAPATRTRGDVDFRTTSSSAAVPTEPNAWMAKTIKSVVAGAMEKQRPKQTWDNRIPEKNDSTSTAPAADSDSSLNQQSLLGQIMATVNMASSFTSTPDQSNDEPPVPSQQPHPPWGRSQPEPSWRGKQPDPSWSNASNEVRRELGSLYSPWRTDEEKSSDVNSELSSHRSKSGEAFKNRDPRLSKVPDAASSTDSWDDWRRRPSTENTDSSSKVRPTSQPFDDASLFERRSHGPRDSTENKTVQSINSSSSRAPIDRDDLYQRRDTDRVDKRKSRDSNSGDMDRYRRERSPSPKRRFAGNNQPTTNPGGDTFLDAMRQDRDPRRRAGARFSEQTAVASSDEHNVIQGADGGGLDVGKAATACDLNVTKLATDPNLANIIANIFKSADISSAVLSPTDHATGVPNPANDLSQLHNLPQTFGENLIPPESHADMDLRYQTPGDLNRNRESAYPSDSFGDATNAFHNLGDIGQFPNANKPEIQSTDDDHPDWEKQWRECATFNRTDSCDPSSPNYAPGQPPPLAYHPAETATFNRTDSCDPSSPNYAPGQPPPLACHPAERNDWQTESQVDRFNYIGDNAPPSYRNTSPQEIPQQENWQGGWDTDPLNGAPFMDKSDPYPNHDDDFSLPFQERDRPSSRNQSSHGFPGPPDALSTANRQSHWENSNEHWSGEEPSLPSSGQHCPQEANNGSVGVCSREDSSGFREFYLKHYKLKPTVDPPQSESNLTDGHFSNPVNKFGGPRFTGPPTRGRGQGSFGSTPVPPSVPKKNNPNVIPLGIRHPPASSAPPPGGIQTKGNANVIPLGPRRQQAFGRKQAPGSEEPMGFGAKPTIGERQQQPSIQRGNNNTNRLPSLLDLNFNKPPVMGSKLEKPPSAPEINVDRGPRSIVKNSTEKPAEPPPIVPKTKEEEDLDIVFVDEKSAEDVQLQKMYNASSAKAVQCNKRPLLPKFDEDWDQEYNDFCSSLRGKNQNQLRSEMSNLELFLCTSELEVQHWSEKWANPAVDKAEQVRRVDLQRAIVECRRKLDFVWRLSAGEVRAPHSRITETPPNEAKSGPSSGWNALSEKSFLKEPDSTAATTDNRSRRESVDDADDIILVDEKKVVNAATSEFDEYCASIVDKDHRQLRDQIVDLMMHIQDLESDVKAVESMSTGGRQSSELMKAKKAVWVGLINECRRKVDHVREKLDKMGYNSFGQSLNVWKGVKIVFGESSSSAVGVDPPSCWDNEKDDESVRSRKLLVTLFFESTERELRTRNMYNDDNVLELQLRSIELDTKLKSHFAGALSGRSGVQSMPMRTLVTMERCRSIVQDAYFSTVKSFTRVIPRADASTAAGGGAGRGKRHHTFAKNMVVTLPGAAATDQQQSDAGNDTRAFSQVTGRVSDLQQQLEQELEKLTGVNLLMISRMQWLHSYSSSKNNIAVLERELRERMRLKPEDAVELGVQLHSVPHWFDDEIKSCVDHRDQLQETINQRQTMRGRFDHERVQLEKRKKEVYFKHERLLAQQQSLSELWSGYVPLLVERRQLCPSSLLIVLKHAFNLEKRLSEEIVTLQRQNVSECAQILAAKSVQKVVEVHCDELSLELWPQGGGVAV